jgi:DNA repair exonuclease SbcCD ATPase subunit
MVVGKNPQRANDELRQHISKLKAELDSERAKSRQLHRDKVIEVKQSQEACKEDRERAIANLQSKWQQEKASELQRLRDSLNKEHDQEIRQMLKEHEEEMREMKFQLMQENKESLKAALELQRQSFNGDGKGDGPLPRPSSGNTALVVKLQREIVALRESKRACEEQLVEALDTVSDLNGQLETCRSELEQKGSDDEQMAFCRELQEQLKKADVALEAKLKEIKQQSSLVNELQQDKQTLQKEIESLKTSSDDPVDNRNCDLELSLGRREGTFTIEEAPKEDISVSNDASICRADSGISGFENDSRCNSSHSGVSGTLHTLYLNSFLSSPLLLICMVESLVEVWFCLSLTRPQAKLRQTQ